MRRKHRAHAALCVHICARDDPLARAHAIEHRLAGRHRQAVDREAQALDGGAAVAGSISHRLLPTASAARARRVRPSVGHRFARGNSTLPLKGNLHMKLGVHIGYWGLGISSEDQLKIVREAEQLGYDSVWAAEAYGSDTATVLGWLAGQTSTIRLGSGIFQMPGRSAAMTAMTAATIDQLSGGRMLLGIGSSGPQLEEGATRSGKSLDGFDIAPTVNVFVTDDLAAARDAMRPFIALYVGGMGSREQNFYNRVVQRYGFEAEAKTIQDLYLEGKREEAMAAIPEELIDTVSLCGPRDVVRERISVYRDAGVGTLGVTPIAFTAPDRLEQLRLVAELAA